MRALVIVDIQNDFLPTGSLPAAGSDRVVSVANELMDKFDCVVAVRDFHPSNHCSFAQTHGKKIGEVITIQTYQQTLWPVHCVAGTKGAEFPKELRSNRFARVFDKGSDPKIDSYGGFFDNGQIRETGLNQFLKEQGVDHIFVVGLTTEYCVKATVLDGLRLGFRVSVVTDGIRAVDVQSGDGERALKQMAAAGADLVCSQSIR